MKRQQGFTLVELTIVVVLIGMMLTLGISALNSQMKQFAVSATIKKQEIVRDALLGYLRQNKRLPCPDLSSPPNGSGDDDRQTPGNVTTTCVGDTGVLPYADLGLGREIALDGWENYQTYKVTTPNWTVTANFAQGNAGAFRILDRDTAGVTTTTATNVVAALVSHGVNGLGAATVSGTFNVAPIAGTDEASNATRVGVTDIFKRAYSEIPIGAAGAFDDVVTFLTRNDLINPLIQDGSLRSPEGELNRIKSDVYYYVASKVLASGSTPNATEISSAGLSMQGPWGGIVSYTQGCSTVSTCVVGGAAYTLTFRDASNSVITILQPVDPLRVLYQSSLPPASASNGNANGNNGAGTPP